MFCRHISLVVSATMPIVIYGWLLHEHPRYWCERFWVFSINYHFVMLKCAIDFFTWITSLMIMITLFIHIHCIQMLSHHPRLFSTWWTLADLLLDKAIRYYFPLNLFRTRITWATLFDQPWIKIYTPSGLTLFQHLRRDGMLLPTWSPWTISLQSDQPKKNYEKNSNTITEKAC